MPLVVPTIIGHVKMHLTGIRSILVFGAKITHQSFVVIVIPCNYISNSNSIQEQAWYHVLRPYSPIPTTRPLYPGMRI